MKGARISTLPSRGVAMYDRHSNDCRDQEPGLRAAYGLCQQMTHFFHQLRLYITFEVIEPAWLHMNLRMKTAKTLDEVINCTSAPCCTQTHAWFGFVRTAGLHAGCILSLPALAGELNALRPCSPVTHAHGLPLEWQ